MDVLKTAVHEKLGQLPPAEDYADFLEPILQRYGRRIIGIFMYGSVLSSVTRSSTSFPDFFVITDGYRGVFRSFLHWLLAWPLPPHIYHLSLPDGRNCKYNLVSLRRFRRECSRRAKDIYILGRFGKRVALVYARDGEARKALGQCCFDAMRNVALWTARGAEGDFDGREFTLDCLNLSYRGETRVEAVSKVAKLFEAEKDFYLQIYPGLLEKDPRLHALLEKTGPGSWRPRGGRLALWWRRTRLRWFLKKSRIRGILRWPKFLVTVDNWVDILLAKIERTKGIKIELTPRERRWPLIFGWPYFFRLLRAGAIRSAGDKPPVEPHDDNNRNDSDQ
ncbi:MAG: hypothetical protein D6806_08165 [Deltaproteobacteria bacterium]|nr:MAG: hypothetical protein D6806_08165 [Deltaproteobacteria bacterium]